MELKPVQEKIKKVVRMTKEDWETIIEYAKTVDFPSENALLLHMIMETAKNGNYSEVPSKTDIETTEGDLGYGFLPNGEPKRNPYSLGPEDDVQL